jgi:N-succinyldiaminopimelate aminotransferase
VTTLVARLRPFTSTIFTEITTMAIRTGAVNLGQGMPDTDGPPGMLAAARQAISDGINQYPMGPGIPELRTAAAGHRRRYHLEYEPEGEILVTTGATEAIAAALLGLVEPGDEVVLIEPYYDSYSAGVALAGGVRRSVPLRSTDSGGYRLDLTALRAAMSDSTRAIVVNTPHNPTGAVLTEEELREIARLCVAHDVIAISDEVYEEMTFDGTRHLPLATLPGMWERTVSVSSAGKLFSVTGWKIGWACGPAELIAAVRTAKQFMTFATGAPFQPAVAYALGNEMDWVAGLRKELRGKRDRLSAGLADAGLGVMPSEGTYFVCADIRPLGFDDGRRFCQEIPARIGVAAIPVQVFCDDENTARHLVRFAFCKRDEVLDTAIDRLRKLR